MRPRHFYRVILPSFFLFALAVAAFALGAGFSLERAATLGSALFLVLAGVTVFCDLLFDVNKEFCDVDAPAVLDRSARDDSSLGTRPGVQRMPALPDNVVRLEDRPRATFSQPAAKGFIRAGSSGE